MDTLCYELLNGTLTWNGGEATFSTTVTNNLPMALVLDAVPNPGAPMPTLSGSYQSIGLAPGASFTIFSRGTQFDDYPAGYYKASVGATGGLVDVFECSSTVKSVDLNWTALNTPNDIGPIPVPTASLPVPVDPQPNPPRPGSTLIIPPDSARVLVGCGNAPNGNLVIREQYWERQNDSICLAGHEKRTVSYTVTSGMEQTSSDTETMSGSLSSSISGGWGPVSASISASLSKTSTSFQQVTVSQETTSYISNKIYNPHDEPIAFLRWQLVDVITVFDKTTSQPVASLMQSANPTVVMGPYWISPRQKPPLGEAAACPTAFFEYEAT
jgi:hypothetical protein